MARLALKPDATFFRTITVGAIGARRVCTDLGRYGHHFLELERGSLDTKLWKEVKRKRVRIPDLVCLRCGMRIESRAKTTAGLAMSHSLTDAERAWDFGLVDNDVLAFPICRPTQELIWGNGRLGNEASYWHQRNWVRWRADTWVSYFRVQSFRATPYNRSARKGVTEGSEVTLMWDAVFSPRAGTVMEVNGRRVSVVRATDGHRHTWKVPMDQNILVAAGESVAVDQLLSATVVPISGNDLRCPAELPTDHINQLLTSRERTQRFTGVKLARLRRDARYNGEIRSLADDAEEDVYIRLEALTYLVSVRAESATSLFEPFLSDTDDQRKLEAVIALGEAGTAESLDLLSAILVNQQRPYFMRSAAAWCLSQSHSDAAAQKLIRAFADVDPNVREEALEGIVLLGGPAIPFLLAGLDELDPTLAAGCAEALRQQAPLPPDALTALTENVRARRASPWTVWLLGNLPRDEVVASLVGLEETAPELHYALTLLWSFVDSWIARRWELCPGAEYPENDRTDEVDSTA